MADDLNKVVAEYSQKYPHLFAIADDEIIDNLAYARVSRAEQASKRHGLETQLNRLIASGCTKILVDITSGRSWGDRKRDDFKIVCSLVKAKRVKQITVTALDRLSRESTKSAEFLQSLEDADIWILELARGSIYNLSKTSDWLESRQKGLQAEFESRQISDRVRAGYENLRGQHKASPQVPFGYNRVNQKYTQNLDEIDIAKDQIKIFFEQKTLLPSARLIYERHGKSWSAQGLRNWLLNPVLCGHTPYGRKNTIAAYLPQGSEIIYNTHPDQAIMTDAQQKEIAEILTENNRIWGKNRKAMINPFSGLVFCGECGRTCDLLSRISGGSKVQARRIRSFYCRARTETVTGVARCSQKSYYRYELVESHVIDILTNKALEISAYAEIPETKTEHPRLKKLRDDLVKLEAMDLEYVAPAIAKLKIEIQQLEHTSDQVQAIDTGLRAELIEVFSDRGFFEALLPEDRKALYRHFIERIIVRDRRVVDVVLRI